MLHLKSFDYKKEEIILARFAKALGHPARIEILNILRETNGCYCNDIVEQLPIAQATVSQHLKVLKEAGLIDGNIAPPKVCYCINKENWAKAKFYFENIMNLPL